jgi:Holliday junction resolvase RusA-like endonuclease
MVPVPKARARVTRHGTYTPKRTVGAEKTLKDYVFHAMHPRKAAQCPIALTCRFIFPVPASWSKKKRQAAFEKRILHTQKPDLDNLVKLVKDALNGVAYVDDAQIVSESNHKDWGGVGRVEIEVTELVALEGDLLQ